VGSAIVRELLNQGYDDIIEVSSQYMRRGEISYDNGGFDLRYENNVDKIFKKYSPQYVINAAGKVGGIHANNTYSAEFTYDNVLMQTNIIHACYRYNVRKLLLLGSSCIYPKFCEQPIKENMLLSSYLEPTNMGYAIAKISAIVMARMYNKQYGSNFISAMPTNIYGAGDNFDISNSHVLPAMIRKFHEAKVHDIKSVELWGTGVPTREFLHVDDLSNAVVFLMNNYTDCNEHVNIGSGFEISIKDLALLVRDAVDYDGKIFWNIDYPDGTPRKLLDSTKLNNLGWKPKISLETGIKQTYDWFVNNYQKIRK